MISRNRRIVEFIFPDYLNKTLEYIEKHCQLDGGYGEYDYLVGVIIAKELGLDPYELGGRWEYESDFFDKAIVTIYED